MNYNAVYWNLIKKAITRNDLTGQPGIDYEIHHIIPKACGGSNKDYNLVKLTVKEHVFAHYILKKFVDDNTYTVKKNKSISKVAQQRIKNFKKGLKKQKIQQFINNIDFKKFVQPSKKIFNGQPNSKLKNDLYYMLMNGNQLKTILNNFENLNM